MTNLQIPGSVVMIRPSSFGYNEETAGSNAFQSAVKKSPEEIRKKAAGEFDGLVRKLKAASVDVFVFDETPDGDMPDAVFPNNWISFQPDGSIVLYPMLAANRRRERRLDIPEMLRKYHHVGRIIDLTGHERENRFLEGTGSIVFDHVNRIAYANTSKRTDEGLLQLLCEIIDYDPCVFQATDSHGKDIYHTNVLLTVGAEFSVLCSETIVEKDRDRVTHMLKETDHRLVEISYKQMKHFAGNMIQLAGKTQSILVMSESAYRILNVEQKLVLEQYNKLLHSSLKTIETYGGGSARCMIAGVHLPRKA